MGPRFLPDLECVVQAAPIDETQSQLTKHTDFRIDSGVPCPHAKAITLQILYKGTLDYLTSTPVAEEITAGDFLSYFKENKSLVA